MNERVEKALVTLKGLDSESRQHLDGLISDLNIRGEEVIIWKTPASRS